MQNVQQNLARGITSQCDQTSGSVNKIFFWPLSIEIFHFIAFLYPKKTFSLAIYLPTKRNSRDSTQINL